MPSQDPTMSDQATSRERAAAPLDDERLASMADEGSTSGALMELEDDGERKHLLSVQRAERARPLRTWRIAAIGVALFGFSFLAVQWLKRRS
jgi:hypothetical protein